jgi:hypothetical protein
MHRPQQAGEVAVPRLSGRWESRASVKCVIVNVKTWDSARADARTERPAGRNGLDENEEKVAVLYSKAVQVVNARFTAPAAGRVMARMIHKGRSTGVPPATGEEGQDVCSTTIAHECGIAEPLRLCC